jgi:hypothetical protein
MSFAALSNLDDGKIPWLKRSRVFGAVIKPQLDALVLQDQIFLRLHHTPPVYQARVVYREEPPTIVTLNDGRVITVEEFASAPVCLARGWADCDDLAPWRCAELRNKGERATVRLYWRQQQTGQKLYHIVVRRPANVPDFDPRFMVRASDGSVVEDPSAALGMPMSIAQLRRDALLK